MRKLEATMKIAVPIFNERVSPRFDAAPSVLIVTIADGRPVDRREIQTRNWTLAERLAVLDREGVTVLICGGIGRRTLDRLCAGGLRVFSWVTGESDDALEAFLRGTLESGIMTGRGGRCCGHWELRGRRWKRFGAES